MNENSFILFKIENEEPDYLNIYNELRLDIEKEELHIDEQEQIRFTPNLMEQIWG